MVKSILSLLVLFCSTALLTAQTPAFGATSYVGGGPSYTCTTAGCWEVQSFASVDQVQCEAKIKVYDDQNNVLWTQNLGMWTWYNLGTSGVCQTEFSTDISPDAPEGLVKVHVKWTLDYSHSGQHFGMTDDEVVATWVKIV